MADQKDKRKEYPARKFHRATVVCPSCLQRFKQVDEQCQRCGFDALRVVQQFQFHPPVLERFIGHADVIDEKTVRAVSSAVDNLVKKFPQVGLHFCFLDLDEPVKLSEFGFWMMNACQLEVGQDERDRAWSMLMLIDSKRGLVSLTPGYAIEAFIEDSAWEAALVRISKNLVAKDYRSALLAFVKRAEQLLYESATYTRKILKKKSKSSRSRRRSVTKS